MASFRWIPEIDEDRARQRATLMYRVLPTLQLGVEVNPLADDIGPLANWLVVKETAKRPAIMLGTSSDRIGTPKGQVYFATASKSLEPWLDIPVAPYVGAGWSDRTNEWEELLGINYRLFDDRYAVTHLWDGVNLHHTVNTHVGRAVVGVIVAEQEGDYSLGITVGAIF